MLKTGMPSTRHIAVIGAGTSGLTATKCCKDQGMAVTCFEKTDNFGGRWRYRKTSIPGVSSVMKSTVSVHSKEISAFSDFPPPEYFPNYMHHTKMLDYLRLYAEYYELLPHIKTGQEVTRLEQAADYQETGKWLVTSLNSAAGTTALEEYDAVMVCTGRLSHPYIPSYPSIKLFQGRVLHTHELKDPSSFENLDVLIVGSGNSAMDASVDISTFAKQVYITSRSGTWLLPKVGPKGLPFDLALLQRHVHILKQYFKGAVSHFLEKYIETKLQHALYQLKPNHRIWDKQPTTNDIIPDKILTGRVCVKGRISHFEESVVHFEGEDKPIAIDAIIFATGYEPKLPILSNKIYKSEEGSWKQYKRVFPVDMLHPTLAIIGFVESQGPIGPIAELQSRWACQLFNKKLKLPTDIRMQTKILSNPVFEDYIDYMDDIARECDAKPNLSLMIFKDPYLYWKVMTGPLIPYQYRLNEPQSYVAARTAILGMYPRVIFPLSARSVANKATNDNNNDENQTI